MDNFTFQNTTKIHFGEGQISQITNEIPLDKKVLVLYGGGSIKKNGVYQQVQEALKNHTWQEFSGIEPNPQYDTLMQAVSKIKKENIEYLLAVGGGSVVDGTKFIAAATLYEGADPWDICSKGAIPTKALPLSCVLTLPATGSETNIGAVVSRGKNKLHFHSEMVRPQFAILDPTTTISLPERQTANGVIDAFVHVMEQYLTYPVNAKIQDRFAEGLLQTLIEEGPKVMQNPNNIPARSNVMLSATLALNQFIGSGVPQDWSTHMIGHEITGLYGVDHARTLSIILPAVMKVQQKEKEEKILQYTDRVLGIKEGSKEDRIKLAIEKTVSFFKEMKVPTSFSDVELCEKDIEPILKSLESHGRLCLGEKSNIDIKKSEEILKAAL